MRSTPKLSKQSRREDRLDAIFGALASRTRRALLTRLGQGPAYLTELAEPFDMSLPAISKHVRVLENAGLLSREIDGRVHRCSLDPAPLRTVEEWLADYRQFWIDTLGALAAFTERPTGKPRKAR